MRVCQILTTSGPLIKLILHLSELNNLNQIWFGFFDNLTLLITLLNDYTTSISFTKIKADYYNEEEYVENIVVFDISDLS